MSPKTKAPVAAPATDPRPAAPAPATDPATPAEPPASPAAVDPYLHVRAANPTGRVILAEVDSAHPDHWGFIAGTTAVYTVGATARVERLLRDGVIVKE